MKRQVTLPLALIIGIGVSALTAQGLHAQGKPKAFTISEVEILDKTALDAFNKAITPVVKEAGGRALDTVGGKVISLTGQAPKSVVMVEWDSLDKAEAYYESTYSKFSPQRDKAWKTIRTFAVEASPNFKGFNELKGSKPHAYVIGEVEVIDRAALSNLPSDSGITDAGGVPYGGVGGKVVARIGEPAKAITLWGFGSLEQAEAYMKSPAWDNRRPQLEKALKFTRSYIVEATQ
jgi:uncharacterized protein (DUF1330 family)